MSARYLRVVLAGIAALPFGSTAHAADLGTAFTYQGSLENPPGTPVNDTCTFEFKLCDAALPASCMPGTVSSHPGIVVTGGVFTVNDLDFGALGIDGTARWLEIQLCCPSPCAVGLPLIPRVELTPAPYALRAAQGVGPPGVLEVTPSGQVNLAGPGMDNQLSFDADNWTMTALSDTGSAPLTIESRSSNGGKTQVILDDASSSVTITGEAGAGNTAGIAPPPKLRVSLVGAVANTAAADSYVSIAAYEADDVTPVMLRLKSGNTNTLNVTTAGRVGIGTDTPGELLDVAANIHAGGTITSGSTITIDGTSGSENISSSASLDLRTAAGRALRLENNATSPNVIGGHNGNNVTAGLFGATISGGGVSVDPNVVNADFGTIGGGQGNTAGGIYSTIGGGVKNTASGYSSTGGGGIMNTASGALSTVGGGGDNTASAESATVVGGRYNAASAAYATIAGGGWSTPGNSATANRVTDDYGTVGGGGNNQAGDNAGTTADRTFATVGGGLSNTASGYLSTVGGGQSNTASANWTIIAGGSFNIASQLWGVVGGGGSNQALGQGDTVGGGLSNISGGATATVAGGRENVSTGTYSSVGGGKSNAAQAVAATVAGGESNTAAAWAAVPGGHSNQAGGSYSLAAGRRAKANHSGAFVWADSTDADFTSDGANKFLVRASGGTAIYSNSGLTAGVTLAAGGGSWSSVSDRNLKENVAEVDARDILERLARVPVTTWNYKSQDDSIRHMGPMGQDFHSAFGIGEVDTKIGTIDADGVALAAIQGLYEIVQEKDCEIENLKSEISELKEDREVEKLRSEIEDLKELVKALAAQNGGGR